LELEWKLEVEVELVVVDAEVAAATEAAAADEPIVNGDICAPGECELCSPEGRRFHTDVVDGNAEGDDVDDDGDGDGVTGIRWSILLK
jgi:hypothetical protein